MPGNRGISILVTNKIKEISPNVEMTDKTVFNFIQFPDS